MQCVLRLCDDAAASPLFLGVRLFAVILPLLLLVVVVLLLRRRTLFGRVLASPPSRQRVVKFLPIVVFVTRECVILVPLLNLNGRWCDEEELDLARRVGCGGEVSRHGGANRSG